MDVDELQSAYESAAEAYQKKSEAMLRMAYEEHEAEAFRAASDEVEQLWARLCELRSLLSMRLETPKSSHDQID